jgi:O-antigen/teichoic acid export membrane protein
VSIEKRTTKAALIVSVAGIVVVLLSYLLRVILARTLTLADYGLFYAVFAVVQLFLFFEGFGTPTALVKFISQFKSQEEYGKIKTIIFSTFFIQLISLSFISLILYLIAPFLAEHYFKTSAAELLIKLFVLYILLGFLFKLTRGIFNGFQKFKIFALMEPIRLIIVIFSLFILLALDYGVLAPILAFNIAWILTVLFFVIPLFKTVKFSKYKISKPYLMGRKLLKFGFPLMFVGVSSKVISYLDTIVLTYFIGLDQVGIYNAILPSSLIFLFLGNALANVLLPVSSELWVSKLKDKISSSLNNAYKFVLFFTLPLILAVMIYAEFFIGFVFGEGFVPGANVFRILLIGVAFFSIAVMNNSILVGVGKTKTVMKILISASIINLILNLILIPSFGIMGAAVSTSFSYILVLAFNYNFIKEKMGVSLNKSNIVKLVIGSLIFALILLILKSVVDWGIWYELIFGILVSGAVYVLFMFKMKVITISELRRLVRKE